MGHERSDIEIDAFETGGWSLEVTVVHGKHNCAAAGGDLQSRQPVLHSPVEAVAPSQKEHSILTPLASLEFTRRNFDNPALEWRRLFSELLGTFLLVLVGAGGGVVNAVSNGQISRAAAVTAPGLMVLAIILFMGAISGAHLNPAVSIAFATRGNFPWLRVPGYIIAQLVGSTLACPAGREDSLWHRCRVLIESSPVADAAPRPYSSGREAATCFNCVLCSKLNTVSMFSDGNISCAWLHFKLSLAQLH